MELSNKLSAVVTGGASGLGEATARMLAARGVKVCLFDVAGERGEAIASELGGIFVEVDVSNVASVDAGLAAARAANGQERILVNCAGIAPPSKTVTRGEPHDAALFQRIVGINLVGTFLCASRSAAGMVAAEPIGPDRERGVIVNTASVAAFDGQIGQAAYAASKSGVVGMTLPMARDLARDGVRVVTIAPGIFATPMLKGMPKEVQDSLGAQVPFPGRLGDPAEFASLTCHIVENVMMNGETMRLDGAIRMSMR